MKETRKIRSKFTAKIITASIVAMMMVTGAALPANNVSMNDNVSGFSIVADAAGNYNSSNAVSYARKYWNNYNSSYRNYNSVGGDCCNFVSQCLKAGGLNTDRTWYNGSYAWINCAGQLSYLKSQGYQAVDWAKASDVRVGDVVYYYNGSRLAHTAICTSIVNGQPRVTAHNKNHVDYEWTLGGSRWWGGSNRRVVVHLNGKTTPTPNPTTKTYTIKSNIGAAVRTGAGTSYGCVGGLAKGSTVTFDKSVNAGGRTWYHIVKVNAKSGSWGRYVNCWCANV